MQFATTVLYTDDVPRAVAFYQKATGCELRFIDLDVQLEGRDPANKYEFAILASGSAELHVATHALGALLMPGYRRPPEGGPVGVEIVFYSDSVGASFRQAVAAGAVPVTSPQVMPWGQEVAYLRGIDDIFICVCSRPASQLPNVELKPTATKSSLVE